ncbi:MAG TPA: heparan N-sulfatase [Verrucomicrobiales bacterium]|mgnify:FL=1|nr:heparan N-sulfatase [Verrucomicrobiales bacterium]
MPSLRLNYHLFITLLLGGLSLLDLGAVSNHPNILFAISDDQSFPHASVYGSRFVKTPAFDRIANEGVLFQQAFCAAPGCSPSRASILTGRNIWQNREAGTHASNFPADLKVFTRALEQKGGYQVGYTGKAWGPGNSAITGWSQNPVGKVYNQHKMDSPAGISGNDYAKNFETFLKDQQTSTKPFFFWFGGHEPHRVYKEGAGVKSGKRLNDAEVPTFLPDHPVVRNDLLDYAVEIEWFDSHLGRMIRLLESLGQLDNTLIIVTADNGMPFPRAKANLYEFGIHAPMAVRWGNEVKGGRSIDDLVSFIDLAPTFLEAAGMKPWKEITGKSLLGLLKGQGSGIIDEYRRWILSGRERHTHARPDNLGYPSRAIRTHRYLYIRNFNADLWPAGDEYHDIDGCPSKSLLLNNSSKPGFQKYFQAAVGKRPMEELFDILVDPGCMRNLASSPGYEQHRKHLAHLLERELKRQRDPRIIDGGQVFDSYPRYSSMRPHLGGFAERGKYNPAFIQK